MGLRISVIGNLLAGDLVNGCSGEGLIERAREVVRGYPLEKLRGHGLEQDLKNYCYSATYPPLKALDDGIPMEVSRAFSAQVPDELNLYFHFPFCSGRCSFCHFNVVTIQSSSLIERYLELLLREIHAFGKNQTGRSKVNSIYFGGGTPSLLPAKAFEQVLDAAQNYFDLSQGARITLEVHPEVLTSRAHEKLLSWRALGINRMSVGVQDFNAEVLRSLRRRHTADEAERVIRLGLESGLAVNLDLMTPLTHQTLETWAQTLRHAFDLRTDSVTLYTTSVRETMIMSSDIRSGMPFLSDESLVFYTMAQMAARAAGYAETVSRWFHRDATVDLSPAAGLREHPPVLGFGAGAYGFYNGVQYFNVPSVHEYEARIQEGTTAVWRAMALDPREKLHRELIFSIRDGVVNFNKFRIFYGADVNALFREKIEALVDCGLATVEGSVLRLSDMGKMLSDELARFFMSPALAQKLREKAQQEARLGRREEHLNHFYDVL